MKVIFTTRLKELREERGLTKTQLGELFHVSRTTVYHWEKGDQEPCIQTISDLADFFGVTTDYLFGRTL